MTTFLKICVGSIIFLPAVVIAFTKLAWHFADRLIEELFIMLGYELPKGNEK